MRTNPHRTSAAFFAVLCMAVTLIVSAVPTEAGFVDDAENAIDSTNALPFKFSEWKPVLAACTGDDMVACADVVSQSQTAQDAGVPSWLPQMIDIYFDVRNKDYWGLVADAGETVACAAAEIITGVDVCGAIKTLVSAAEDVAQGAEAAVQFLADLGSDIAGAIEDIGCDLGLGGCDSGPSPPSQAQLAQIFLASQIPQGLSARQSSQDAWLKFYGSVVGMGTGQGIDGNQLKAALPGFKNSVYQQWDSWIISSILPSWNMEKAKFTPATAANYAAVGMAHVGEIDFSTAYPDFENGYLPIYQPGRDACANVMANSGGPIIETWINEGRPPSSSGIPTPANPATACVAFDNQLKADLLAAIAPKIRSNVAAVCQYHGTPENVYICSKYSEQTCQSSLKLLGDPTQCILYDPGPAKVPFICPPDNHVVQAYVTSPPKGCHPAKFNDLPPSPGGPSHQY